MKNSRQFITWIFVSVLLAACVSAPKFDTRGIDLSISPQQVAAETKTFHEVQVLWGGVIIAGTNLEDATQFEVLAYPLAPDQRPDTDKPPLGRFLALQAGYLETSDFAQGRLVSISGTLQDKRVGHIGEAEYLYPVLEINQLHLWEKRSDSSESQFHIGIGVMFHD